MPTFTLRGFTIDGDALSYIGTTNITITLPANYTFQYQYSNTFNNPGFAIADFGIPGVIIPEAFFDESVNSAVNASPYGDGEFDEIYFANLTLSNGTILTLLTIYEAAADVDHIFVLDSTGPFTIPQSQAQFDTLFGSVVDVSVVTTGPFAAGADLDFALVEPLTLIATSENDVWTGSEDNDVFDGGIGNDSIAGLGGDDDLFGGSGNDTIDAGDGDRDEVYGLAGNDLLFGGAGTRDDLRYDRDAQNGGTNGVNVNLATGIAIDGFGNTDTVSGFERVRGTNFNDTLIGDDGRNQLRGLGGNDFIDGGGGQDQVTYLDATSGVTVNLVTGLVFGGSGNDTLVSIEEAIGSDHNDTLIGNDADNYFEGGFGNDSIDGGDGFDFIGYFESTLGVTVNLATGIVTGDEGTDTVVNIEGVEGSTANDSITGNDGRNILVGNTGDDTLRGGAGRDDLRGELGNDLLDGGDGGDDAVDYRDASGGVLVNLALGFASGADGNDTILNVERIWGSFFDDTLIGDDGDNIIQGRGGDDSLDGGAGFDAVDYFDASGGVNVNLATGLVSGADGNDTLANFEEVAGSFFDDKMC